MSEGIYSIQKNEKFGRYMVANKHIKAGELILSESPLLIGPQVDGPLICLNCCRSLRTSGYIFCKGCNAAVVCSPKCTGKLHSQEECKAFKDIGLNGRFLVENDQVIFPLRCLIMKQCQPEIWKSMMQLESHLEARRGSFIWRRHAVVVEQSLRDMALTSEDDLKNDLIQRICGILDVNTFEVRPLQNHSLVITNPENQCLRGLYLEAALMAHDCMGNTHLSVDDDFVLRVKASVDIPKNSPVLFNYANALQGSLDRKQHLREGKYFECSCNRCNDPTELNTELSSLKCHACRKGLIRMMETTNLESDWQCSVCGKTFKHYLIARTVEEGRMRIKCYQTDITGMEHLLNKLLQTFHENHFLILELEQNMIGVYTQLAPKPENLSRKIELCQRLFDVSSIIEPGISRTKAISLYQLQSAMVDLAHKQYQNRSIDIHALVAMLDESETNLKEAIKYFLYEPLKSPEGRLAQIALSEMKMLRISLGNIKKDLLSGVLVDKQGSTIRRNNGSIQNAVEREKVVGFDTIDDVECTKLDSLSLKKSTKNQRSRRNRKKFL
nr:protein msta-like [Leptinotarsa decemlineata]